MKGKNFNINEMKDKVRIGETEGEMEGGTEGGVCIDTYLLI